MEEKKHFLGKNGKVYVDCYRNRNVERLDLTFLGILNTFDSHESARLARDILDEYFPMMFYGYRKQN